MTNCHLHPLQVLLLGACVGMAVAGIDLIVYGFDARDATFFGIGIIGAAVTLHSAVRDRLRSTDWRTPCN